MATKNMSQNQTLQESSFNSMLFRAVEIALSETVGDSAAKAIGFYVQASLIAKSPDGYSAQLREIFSTSGSDDGPKMIEERIASTLSKLVDGREIDVSKFLGGGANFGELIEECKKNYLKARITNPSTV